MTFVISSHLEFDTIFIKSVLKDRKLSEDEQKGLLKWIPLSLIFEFIPNTDNFVHRKISIDEIRLGKDRFTQTDWKEISEFIKDRYIPEFKDHILSLTSGLCFNKSLSLETLINLRNDFTNSEWEEISQQIKIEWVNYFLDYINFRSLFWSLDENRKISKENILEWSGYFTEDDWDQLSKFIPMDLVDKFQNKINFKLLTENSNLTSEVILRYPERFPKESWFRISNMYSCDVILPGIELDSLSCNCNLKLEQLRELKDKFNKDQWKSITYWIHDEWMEEFDKYIDLEEFSSVGSSLEFIRRHKDEFTRSQWYNIFEWCHYSWMREFKDKIMEDEYKFYYLDMTFFRDLLNGTGNGNKDKNRNDCEDGNKGEKPDSYNWYIMSRKLEYEFFEEFHDRLNLETFWPSINKRRVIKSHYKKFKNVMEELQNMVKCK